MEQTQVIQMNQVRFRSEINRPRPHQYAQGNFKKYMAKYEELIDKKTGKLTLEVTDRVPIDEQIQEYKDMVTLDSLIERYKVDLSKKAITKISEDITDMTLMPQDALECYSLIHQAERNFADTTKEFKAEFNNNFGEYLKGFATGKTQQIVNKYNKNLVKSEAPTILNQQQTEAPTTQTTQQNINNGGTYNV